MLSLRLMWTVDVPAEPVPACQLQVPLPSSEPGAVAPVIEPRSVLMAKVPPKKTRAASVHVPVFVAVCPSLTVTVPWSALMDAGTSRFSSGSSMRRARGR